MFQRKIDQEFDILQQSISHQEEENLEEECLTETILGEQAQLQPPEELKVESTKAPEELQDSPESSVAFLPWKKEEEIIALLTEEGSGIEAGKEPQKLALQPIPMKLNPSATASSPLH